MKYNPAGNLLSLSCTHNPEIPIPGGGSHGPPRSHAPSMASSLSLLFATPLLTPERAAPNATPATLLR